MKYRLTLPCKKGFKITELANVGKVNALVENLLLYTMLLNWFLWESLRLAGTVDFLKLLKYWFLKEFILSIKFLQKVKYTQSVIICKTLLS